MHTPKGRGAAPSPRDRPHSTTRRRDDAAVAGVTAHHERNREAVFHYTRDSVQDSSEPGLMMR